MTKIPLPRTPLAPHTARAVGGGSAAEGVFCVPPHVCIVHLQVVFRAESNCPARSAPLVASDAHQIRIKVFKPRYRQYNRPHIQMAMTHLETPHPNAHKPDPTQAQALQAETILNGSESRLSRALRGRGARSRDRDHGPREKWAERASCGHGGRRSRWKFRDRNVKVSGPKRPSKQDNSNW